MHFDVQAFRASKSTFCKELFRRFPPVSLVLFGPLISILLLVIGQLGHEALHVISDVPKRQTVVRIVQWPPLGKLDLGNQHGFEPDAAFHDCGRNPHPIRLCSSPADLQTDKTTLLAFEIS